MDAHFDDEHFLGTLQPDKGIDIRQIGLRIELDQRGGTFTMARSNNPLLVTE